MRSDRDLCPARCWAIQWQAHGRRSALPVAVQHLRASRAAARPHRQPRRSFAARRLGPGKNRLLVLRGEHPRWPLFRCHACGTQSQRNKVSPPARGVACRPADSATRSTRGQQADREGTGEAPRDPQEISRQTHGPRQAAKGRGPMNEMLSTKKALILNAARAIGAQKFTPAEIEQVRRRLIAEHGEEGKTGVDYIADVLKSAGLRVVLSQQEEAEEQYEDEFEDLLHFKTLEDAELSIMRLDELMRKFQAHNERAAVERVLNVARLGKRRAEMISRNPKVEPHKRAEKIEIANWFRIWLETPDAFFDWLDVRKETPDFQAKCPQAESEVLAPRVTRRSIQAR